MKAIIAVIPRRAPGTPPPDDATGKFESDMLVSGVDIQKMLQANTPPCDFMVAVVHFTNAVSFCLATDEADAMRMFNSMVPSLVDTDGSIGVVVSEAHAAMLKSTDQFRSVH